MRLSILALTIMVIFTTVLIVWADVPNQINFHGTLTDTLGDLLNETVPIQFLIYTSETGGTPSWNETHSTVEVVNGNFDAYLGSINSLPDSTFDGQVLWLELVVESLQLSQQEWLLRP